MEKTGKDKETLLFERREPGRSTHHSVNKELSCLMRGFGFYPEANGTSLKIYKPISGAAVGTRG